MRALLLNILYAFNAYMYILYGKFKHSCLKTKIIGTFRGRNESYWSPNIDTFTLDRVGSRVCCTFSFFSLSLFFFIVVRVKATLSMTVMLLLVTRARTYASTAIGLGDVIFNNEHAFFK